MLPSNSSYLRMFKARENYLELLLYNNCHYRRCDTSVSENFYFKFLRLFGSFVQTHECAFGGEELYRCNANFALLRVSSKGFYLRRRFVTTKRVE